MKKAAGGTNSGGFAFLTKQKTRLLSLAGFFRVRQRLPPGSYSNHISVGNLVVKTKYILFIEIALDDTLEFSNSEFFMEREGLEGDSKFLFYGSVIQSVNVVQPDDVLSDLIPVI